MLFHSLRLFSLVLCVILLCFPNSTMPACSFGVPNTQIMSSNVIHQSRYPLPYPPHVLQAGSFPKVWTATHMTVLQKSNKVSPICCAHSERIEENKLVAPTFDKGEKKKSLPGQVSRLISNSNEVISLVSAICDSTSIAEFELKLNGFHLHVTRACSEVIDLTAPSSPPLISASTTSNTASKELPLNNKASTSLAITKVTKPEPLEIKSRNLLERAADEGLVIIQSPKVGFFRRCRTIKGKRAPPACKEKQLVKEGQVICYIEQLGWEAPIESDVSGEVSKFLFEDGDPVGFGDPIIVILPSFPGIKKLPAGS